MSHRILTLAAFAGLTVSSLFSADFSTYRDLTFGTNLATVVKQSGLSLAAVRTVQKRPATIQELDWQPRGATLGTVSKPESVRDGVLSFLNGELYRIVITYDRYRIEGMTTDDMVEAISSSYGQAVRPVTEIAFHSSYGETAAVLARWEDPSYRYDLVRSGDRTTFAMVLLSKRLNAEAEASMKEAAKLDLAEAPQRELARQKKVDEDAREALEKSRAANKPNFKP